MIWDLFWSVYISDVSIRHRLTTWYHLLMTKPWTQISSILRRRTKFGRIRIRSTISPSTVRTTGRTSKKLSSRHLLCSSKRRRTWGNNLYAVSIKRKRVLREARYHKLQDLQLFLSNWEQQYLLSCSFQLAGFSAHPFVCLSSPYHA